MIGRIRVHTVVIYVVVSKKFGDKSSSKATIVGGAILIVIGPEIFHGNHRMINGKFKRFQWLKTIDFTFFIVYNIKKVRRIL